MELEEDSLKATVPPEELDVEDEVQDWSQLTKMSNHSLPKRGEKDYEPDGTEVQEEMLQKSRNAMFEALEAPRGHIVKQNVRAVWMPSLGKALVKKPKGSFMQTAGYFDKENNCWLNAEEFVYFTERGTIEPWFEKRDLAMDMQSVYSQCFNSDDQIDEYQVYAHLKRLGYIVMRSPNNTIEKRHPDLIIPWIYKLWIRFKESKQVKLITSYLQRINLIAYSPFHNLHFITSRYINYTQIFNSIKLIPYRISKNEDSETTPINVTYNVWKPNPSFSKKSPPLPNFQIVVRNVNKYKLPTLTEINSLLDRTETQPEQRSQNANQMNKLKYGKENIILAIVDYGIINFVKLARGTFGSEDVWYIPQAKTKKDNKKFNKN